MSVMHYAITLETPDDEAPSQEAILKVLTAAFPKAVCRMRESYPNVLVVVTDDPDAAVIFSTDGRVGALVSDARNPNADSLRPARDRIADNKPIEIGSTPDAFTQKREHAVRVLDGIIEDCETTRSFR